MHNSLSVYLLLFAGALLLPVYVMKNGEPGVSRAKALKISTSEREVVLTFMLKYFWPLHLANASALTCVILLLIEGWPSTTWMNTVILCSVGALLTIFAGLLAAAPGYVVVRRWKQQAGSRSGERGG